MDARRDRKEVAFQTPEVHIFVGVASMSGWR
jgi:hypothetical protein